jgi:hypothetical protein
MSRRACGRDFVARVLATDIRNGRKNSNVVSATANVVVGGKASSNGLFQHPPSNGVSSVTFVLGKGSIAILLSRLIA